MNTITQCETIMHMKEVTFILFSVAVVLYTYKFCGLTYLYKSKNLKEFKVPHTLANLLICYILYYTWNWHWSALTLWKRWLQGFFTLQESLPFSSLTSTWSMRLKSSFSILIFSWSSCIFSELLVRFSCIVSSCFLNSSTRSTTLSMRSSTSCFCSCSSVYMIVHLCVCVHMCVCMCTV